MVTDMDNLTSRSFKFMFFLATMVSTSSAIVFGVNLGGYEYLKVIFIIIIIFCSIFLFLNISVMGITLTKEYGQIIIKPTIISRTTTSPSPLQQQKPCTNCQKPLTFIQQNQRWYCYNCKKYCTDSFTPPQLERGEN